MIPLRFLEINYFLGLVFGINHGHDTTSIWFGPIVFHINWGHSWTGY